MIRKYLARRRLRKIRKVLRGYRKLKDQNAVSRINRINEEISENPITSRKSFSTRVFFKGSIFGELITRQFVVNRFLGLRLSGSLLHLSSTAGASLVFPLPSSCQKIIKEHGFKVAVFRSSLLWALLVLVYFLIGIAKVFEGFFAGIVSLFSLSRSKSENSFVYFDGLSSGNIPKRKNADGNKNILSWYLQWNNAAEGIKTLVHSVENTNLTEINGCKIAFRRSPIPKLPAAVLLFIYPAWGIIAILTSILALFRGQWWNALILMDSVKAFHIKYCDPGALASEYLFNNSGWIYRPLWTYIAEERGSEITLYFYSANIEGFQPAVSDGHNDKRVYQGYKAMSWPRYIVWDQWQKDFLDKHVSFPHKTFIAGSIWFIAGSGSPLSDLPDKYIAIFDVQPFRVSFFRSQSVEHDFYIPDVSISFVKDVVSICQKKHISAVFKKKREIGKISHPVYRSFILECIDSEAFIEIPPDTDLYTLIGKATGVVSMPYTSTALIARELGKPSVFYDPVGYLREKDLSSHEIPMINSKEQLENWVVSISENTRSLK